MRRSAARLAGSVGAALVLSLAADAHAQATDTQPAPAPAPAPAPVTPAAGDASTVAPAPEPAPSVAPAAAPAPAPVSTPPTLDPGLAGATPQQQEAEIAPKPRVRSMQEFDVQPTVRILKTDIAEIKAGGLAQVHAALYVGEDALVANNDVASQAGFRLRRAGFGVQGRLLDKVGTIISVNAVQTGAESDRALSNAIIFYEAHEALLLTAGTVKVPFSRAALESSRTFTGIERPLPANLITPSRRLGLTAEGHLFNNHIAYMAGVMNGTEGYALGNQFGGILAGGRIELYPWQSPDPWERRNGLAVAADGLYANEPAAHRVAYSADIYGAYDGAHVKIEGLCDEQTPKDAPVISPNLPDKLRRCGAYAEVGYVLPWPASVPIQPMARFEIMDDNRAVADSGDIAILDTGLNAQIIKQYLRAQAHYIGRYELKGPSRANDAVIVTLQGAF